MASEIDICNQALVKLGESTIASFDEGTDKAAICDTLYKARKEALLTQRSWRFTLARRQLARLTAAPTFGWKYAFQLPSDRLAAPREVYNDDAVNAAPRKDWDVEGDTLLANFEECYIVYQQSPDEVDFPPWFQWLLVLALAADMAHAITDNATLEQSLYQRAFGTPAESGYGGQYRIAATEDMRLETLAPIQDHEIVAARFGYDWPGEGWR